MTDAPPKFREATYANDGDVVWIPFPLPDKPRAGLRCKVACAAGYHVRVVNEAYGVDQWRRIETCYVREDG